MNITEFKNTIHRFNGPARPNLFYVEIFGNNSQYIQDWELRAFCKTATFPGINFQTFDYKPNNIGISTQMPVGINAEPMNCIFIMDSKHLVLRFFHEWMQKIVNWNTTNLNGNKDLYLSIDNQLPYEIGYRKDYSATMKITFFEAENTNSNYSVTLYDVFPTNIGSVTLSWDENDSIATLPVNFTYERMSFDGENFGSRDSRIFQNLDYLTLLNNLNGYSYGASSTSSGSSSLYDLINRVYRIKTDIDYLKEIF